MLFWIKTAALFLLRSKTSTVVMTLMVVMAVSSMVFLASLAVGVNDAMIKNSVSLFSGHIAAVNIPVRISEKQLVRTGVQAVLKRVHTSGFLHYKENMAMLTLVAVDPAKERKNTAIWKKTVKGRYLKSGTAEAYLSQLVADKLHVELGANIGFSSDFDSTVVPLQVVGIYQTGMDQFDREISFCNMSAFSGGSSSWNAAIFLNNGVDKDLVVDNYRHTKLLENITFQTWSDLMPDLRQLIELNYLSMGIVMILVFIVISLGIAGAFSIFILKNVRVYGIMKVMGVTPVEMGFLVFSEVIWINLVASIFGVIAGVAAVLVFGRVGIDLSAYTSHNQYFIVSGMIFPRLTTFSLWIPPASALLFSIPAAIWPAVMIVKRDAAEILRSI